MLKIVFVYLATSPLSCISRAARQLPRIVKRACSPSSYLLRSPPAVGTNPPVPQNSPGNVRCSSSPRVFVPEAQENTPPSPSASSGVRATVRLEDVTPILERYGANNSAPHPRILRPRSPLTPAPSTSTSESIRNRTLSGSTTVSSSSCLAVTSQRKRKNSSSCPFLTSQSEYYQGHFDVPYTPPSSASAQTLIEGKIYFSVFHTSFRVIYAHSFTRIHTELNVFNDFTSCSN